MCKRKLQVHVLSTHFSLVVGILRVSNSLHVSLPTRQSTPGLLLHVISPILLQMRYGRTVVSISLVTQSQTFHRVAGGHLGMCLGLGPGPNWGPPERPWAFRQIHTERPPYIRNPSMASVVNSHAQGGKFLLHLTWKHLMHTSSSELNVCQILNFLPLGTSVSSCAITGAERG